MSAFDAAMRYYPYVFHPVTVLGVGVLVLVHHEWARQDADRSALWRRAGGFLGAGLLSLVPTLAYGLVTGQGLLAVTHGNRWQVDALVAGGIFVAAGVTWWLWTRYDWGGLVPGAMQALVLATVPYAALSPVWNVSGHVIVSLTPTLYLTLVDRKFWPTLLVPTVMVYNRVYLDEHTVAQSVGAFVLTTVLVVGLYWVQTGGSLRPDPDSTTT
ncbi:phosphoesterase [Halorussus sp. AFM4]|uniref:phosphoesterase n=1 Tax=Halorussus sp. AFM4 TaxID=3421651 RepID=UPI003EBA198E